MASGEVVQRRDLWLEFVELLGDSPALLEVGHSVIDSPLARASIPRRLSAWARNVVADLGGELQRPPSFGVGELTLAAAVRQQRAIGVQSGAQVVRAGWREGG